MQNFKRIKVVDWYQGKVYTNSVKKMFESGKLSSSYYEWKEHFTYIHGVFDTQRKIEVQKLEKTFGITIGFDNDEIFKFVYCLETYYSIILRIIAHKTIFGDNQLSNEIFDDDTYAAQGI